MSSLRKIIGFCLCMPIFSNTAYSQMTNIQFDDKSTYVEVVMDAESGAMYKYYVKAGDTYYRLSKVFNEDIETLHSYNRGESLKSGQIIMIPFKGNLANRQRNGQVPVLYKVKKGETLFSICKRYFNCDVADVRGLNKLNDVSLSVDQSIFIGFAGKEEKSVTPIVDLDNIITTTAHIVIPRQGNTIPVIEHEVFDSVISKRTETKPIIEIVKRVKPSTVKRSTRRGVAVWQKGKINDQNLYALHRDARVNSIIEIYNPLVKRKAYARVVGNIPEGLYPSDVSVIISSRVASALGALDSRFLVELKYYE